MNKKTIIYAGIGIFFSSGIAATHPVKENDTCENCKVIPRNTDEDQMERIMHQYTRQLGVTCSYCHPDTKAGISPVRVDFVTDEKPEKLTARKMMMMTDKLNRKYFGYSNDYSFESLNAHQGITCNTCHRGLTKPNMLRLFTEE
jgi:hypothetical protein